MHRHVRGLTAALNGNGKYKYKVPESVVDHLIVGGGVVGLAIAQRLSQLFPRKSTYLVERNSRAGEEISSRNSEVIHAGLYYPVDSLKTQLCLRGRQMLYNHCIEHNVPYRKTGKLVVARNDQRNYIENLHAKAMKLKWPTHSPSQNINNLVSPTELLSGDQARDLEPDLSPNIFAAISSPETGIVDSHAFMESLEKDIIDSEGGELVYSTRVVRVDPYRHPIQALVPNADTAENGWVVQFVTAFEDEGNAILARTLINASGLSGHLILNSLLPERSRIPMYYARGSYAAYSGPGISRITRLIYPCPETGERIHSFQSLGTHLTLDLQGKVRFGPDIQWISPPLDHQENQHHEENTDFWKNHLIPDDSKLEEMHKAVTDYLPGVVLDGMRPDYVGIRPKLVGPGGGFQDFLFRVDFPSDFVGVAYRRGPMISLLGIESPGLTASLAIAEHVVEDILAKVASHV